MSGSWTGSGRRASEHDSYTPRGGSAATSRAVALRCVTSERTRQVSAHVELSVGEPADLVFSVAVAAGQPVDEESLVVTVDGAPVPAVEVAAPVGTRLHQVTAAPVGALVLDYRATLTGSADPAPVTELDPIVFTRPSRYCDSDRLAAVAHTHFGALPAGQAMNAVRDWILNNITYTPGSSDVTDGALEAYLSRQGVCRDSAQLAITFLRALNVPARLVSVYAPGLNPMDFHAVTEVLQNGQWQVIDGTGLAPRESMVRIATGRDAADTAFLTVLRGRADLVAVQADARTDTLPVDDGIGLVQLT